MLKLNKHQNKHIADSLRVVGMAQFAAFGWNAFNEGVLIILIGSGVAYLYAEFLAIRFLQTN